MPTFELLAPYLVPLLWIGGAYVVLRAVAPIGKSYFGYRAKAKGQVERPRGTISKYDTALEMVTDMENALTLQMDHIAEELKKGGKEPMGDATYQIMINDLHRIQGWKGKLSNNPIYMALDAIGFPIIKGLIPDIERAGKRILKDVI